MDEECLSNHAASASALSGAGWSATVGAWPSSTTFPSTVLIWGTGFSFLVLAPGLFKLRLLVLFDCRPR